MNYAQHILAFAVRVYQRIFSPVLAMLVGPYGRCRFEPSCSQFAIEAIQIHGALKGIALASGRICRCAPWGGCGADPVPPKPPESQEFRFKESQGAEDCICSGSRAAGGVSSGRA